MLISYMVPASKESILIYTCIGKYIPSPSNPLSSETHLLSDIILTMFSVPSLLVCLMIRHSFLVYGRLTNDRKIYFSWVHNKLNTLFYFLL